MTIPQSAVVTSLPEKQVVLKTLSGLSSIAFQASAGVEVVIEGRYGEQEHDDFGCESLMAHKVRVITGSRVAEFTDLGNGMYKKVVIDRNGIRTDKISLGDVRQIGNRILGVVV